MRQTSMFHWSRLPCVFCRRRAGDEVMTPGQSRQASGRKSYESGGDAARLAAADLSTQLRVLSDSAGALMQAAVIERLVPIGHPAKRLEIRLSDEKPAARGDPPTATSGPCRRARNSYPNLPTKDSFPATSHRLTSALPGHERVQLIGGYLAAHFCEGRGRA